MPGECAAMRARLLSGFGGLVSEGRAMLASHPAEHAGAMIFRRAMRDWSEWCFR